jgi:hypothetical protein
MRSWWRATRIQSEAATQPGPIRTICLRFTAASDARASGGPGADTTGGAEVSRELKKDSVGIRLAVLGIALSFFCATWMQLPAPSPAGHAQVGARSGQEHVAPRAHRDARPKTPTARTGASTGPSVSNVRSVVLSPAGVAMVFAAAALLIAAGPLVRGSGLPHGIRLIVALIVVAAMLCAVGATIEKACDSTRTAARAVIGITDAVRHFPLATVEIGVLAALASVGWSPIARLALALRLAALRLAEVTAGRRRPLPTPA